MLSVRNKAFDALPHFTHSVQCYSRLNFVLVYAFYVLQPALKRIVARCRAAQSLRRLHPPLSHRIRYKVGGIEFSSTRFLFPPSNSAPYGETSPETRPTLRLNLPVSRRRLLRCTKSCCIIRLRSKLYLTSINKHPS